MAYRLYNPTDAGLEANQQPQDTQKQDPNYNPILRNILRTDAVIASRLAGLPGDIAQGGLAVGNLASRAITGKEYLPKSIGFLPTSAQNMESYKEKAKNFGKEGYLDPQSATERKADEVVGDLTTLLHPLQTPYSKFNIAKGLASAGVGHGLKFIAEQFPEFEKYGDAAKLGGMLLTSFGMGSGIGQQASDLRKAALNAVPSGTTINSRALITNANHIKRLMRDGIRMPHKKFVSDRADDIIRIVEESKGELAPDKIVKLIDEMNMWFKDPSFPQASRKFMGSMINDLYGVLENAPNLPKNITKGFRESQDLFKVMQTSSGANDFIQKAAQKVKDKLLHPLALFFSGNPSKMIIGAGALHGVQGGSKMIDNFMRSPAARRAYAKLATSALEGKSGIIAKNLVDFDRVLRKEVPKEQEGRYRIYQPS